MLRINLAPCARRAIASAAASSSSTTRAAAQASRSLTGLRSDSRSSSLLSSTLAHRTYVSRPPERNTIDEEPTIDPNHVDEDEIPSQLPKKSRKDKLYDFFIDRSPRATGHEDQWLVKNEKKMWTLSATTMAILLFLIFLPADDPRLDSIEWSKFPIEWVQTLGKEADGAAAAEGGSGSGKAAGQASSDGLYKVITVRTPDDHKPIKGNPETCVEGMYHVMIMDPELQIERPYTIFPPPPHVTGIPTQFSIFVKRESQGEVSRYLHRLTRFKYLHARGPYITETDVIRPQSIAQDPDLPRLKGWSLQGWDRVIMISGGTGVAPYIQLLHTICPPYWSDAPTPVLPRITLLHTSTTLPLAQLAPYFPDAYLLPAKLELADLGPSRFSLESVREILQPSQGESPLAIARSGPGLLASVLGKLGFGPTDEDDAHAAALATPAALAPGRPTPIVLEDGKKTLILVSGPDGMIEAVSGPQHSKEVGGILAQLGIKGEGVEVRRFWNKEMPLRRAWVDEPELEVQGLVRGETGMNGQPPKQPGWFSRPA